MITLMTGGDMSTVPESQPRFPLPYVNDFESDQLKQQPRLMAQSMGAWYHGQPGLSGLLSLLFLVYIYDTESTH